MAKSTSKTTTETPKQPLFYKDPAPITLEKHLEAGIAAEENYLFAKGTNSTPITISEVMQVSKDYPLVFTNTPKPELACVLGFENEKNLMVNSDGMWAKDKYIPAYVRRYPFAFMQLEGDKLILCVDESSNRYMKKPKKGDMMFFENKEQSALTKNALDFCAGFHRDYMITEKFVAAVVEAGLLKTAQVNITVKNKTEPYTLSGFMTVDETKFQNLDSKTLVEWHKNGYLGILYFHMQSLSNFNNLIKLAK